MILPQDTHRMSRPIDSSIRRLILRLALLLAALVIAASLCWHSLFVVDETQTALLLSFGRTVRGPIVEAGLHVKRPWQTVRKFDRRLHVLECEPREKRTYNNEPVVVQPYACWRIAPEDAELYLRAVGDRDGAEAALMNLIWGTLDRAVSTHTLTDWFHTIGQHASADWPAQTQIMDSVAHTCRQKARRCFGIELLAVRLRRLTRPEWMKEDIYKRMIVERKRTAEGIRQSSTTRATQIRTDARQEADRILAEARNQAKAIRVQSKRQADRLFSEARRFDPELTALAEKLNCYRELLDGKATLVLSGDPDLFGSPSVGFHDQQAAPASQPATRPNEQSQ